MPKTLKANSTAKAPKESGPKRTIKSSSSKSQSSRAKPNVIEITTKEIGPTVKGLSKSRTMSEEEIDEDDLEDSQTRPSQVNKALFSMKNFQAERDLPIVYCKEYNISVMGLELLHHFDSKKYAKIADHLNIDFMDTPWARHRHYDEPPPREGEEESKMQPRRLRFLAPNRPVKRAELELHHMGSYVAIIHETKSTLARIMETWALNLVPMFLIESHLMTPIKWQIAGTIYAFHLAMQHGWALNVGGGFHQSSSNGGETFCLFSDVLVAIKYVWRRHPLQKFMIIDLDAHQAIGIEKDLLAMGEKQRKKLFLVDVYNPSVQPPNPNLTRAIDLRVELPKFAGDKTYLGALDKTLAGAFERFKPTLVVYVAGQDVLKNDQLGLLNLSEDALFKRDEMVFTHASQQDPKCPVVMLLAGGYLAMGARIQADSIRNLYAKGLIWGGHKSGQRSLSRPRQFPRTKGTISSGGSQGSRGKKPS